VFAEVTLRTMNLSGKCLRPPQVRYQMQLPRYTTGLFPVPVGKAILMSKNAEIRLAKSIFEVDAAAYTEKMCGFIQTKLAELDRDVTPGSLLGRLRFAYRPVVLHPGGG
jgi:hypothetical protein